MKLFPAIQGTVGTWKYYSTKMTASDLAGQVRFASEVWDSKALDHWIQRALNENRAKDEISAYLAKHDDRFFNSIVVAAIDGNPTFFPVQIADDPQFALIADDRMNSSFGVLRFDGTQKYYALDGQHRLKAVKALIENETPFVPPSGFSEEEFSVILVVQKENETQEEFMRKYRRLFSHLNRHAKPMDKATTIIMEEDDAFAIITRRLVQEHEFFSWIEGDSTRVRCEKSENMRVGEVYFTNIITLYKMTRTLLTTPERNNSPEWGENGKEFLKMRPTDQDLEKLYDELCCYWDAILEILPDLRKDTKLMRSDHSEDQIVDGEVTTNSLLFRPIGQLLLAEVVRAKLNHDLDDMDTFTAKQIEKTIERLKLVDWRLYSPPWRNLLFVYEQDEDKWKMRNEERKEAIVEAKRVLRWLVGCDHYETEEDLAKNLRDPWKARLYGISQSEKDEIWNEVLTLAEQMRG